MWWELKIGNNRGKLEEFLLLIPANSMEEALQAYKDNQGDSNIRGPVEECRQVYYVKSHWVVKKS